jgi:hypothetical protein
MSALWYPKMVKHIIFKSVSKLLIMCYKMASHINKINALQQYSLYLAYILSMNFDVWSFTKICEHIASLKFDDTKGHYNVSVHI